MTNGVLSDKRVVESSQQNVCPYFNAQYPYWTRIKNDKR